MPRSSDRRSPARADATRVLRSRRGLVLFAVAACALGIVHVAGAWRVEGRPWPDGRIHYFNEASDQSWAVRKAVAAWNRSGARIQFVQTTKQRADIVIRHIRTPGCGGSRAILGQASVGYARNPVVYVRPLDEASIRCNRFTSATAVAHELGHVLGLGHEDRGCALMNGASSLWGPTHCPRESLREWRCRLVTSDDVAGAVRLYGGAVREQTGPETCRFWASILRPGSFRARYRADQGGVGLSFVRPNRPRLPAFMTRIVAGIEHPQESFAFMAKRDGCPTNDDVKRARRVAWSVAPGQRLQIYDRAKAPGTYCYAVWAYDQVGLTSDMPALARATVPS